MPDFPDNRTPEHDGEELPPASLNPMLLFLLMAICLLFVSSFVQVKPNQAPAGEKTAPETEIRANDPEASGPYPLESQTISGNKTLLVYEADGSSESKLIANAGIAREPGEDMTVELEKQTFDEVEKESGDIVRENAKPASWKATIYYDPEKREQETFRLVSLEKNGSSPATLTYEEANGITDTVKLSPSSIDVVDDGTGLVEKVCSYDDGGIWTTHWTVHSLPR